MKYSHLSVISVLALLSVASAPGPLYAADPISVSWNQVCRFANNRELLLTTATGDTVDGFCIGIDVNEITVSTQDHRIVKIARTTLSRIEMRRARGHQLRSLRDDMIGGLGWGVGSLLTEWFPAGLLIIPGSLAWGAVAAPFSLLGDLKAKVSGTREIRPD